MNSVTYFNVPLAVSGASDREGPLDGHGRGRRTELGQRFRDQNKLRRFSSILVGASWCRCYTLLESPLQRDFHSDISKLSACRSHRCKIMQNTSWKLGKHLKSLQNTEIAWSQASKRQAERLEARLREELNVTKMEKDSSVNYAPFGCLTCEIYRSDIIYI